MTALSSLIGTRGVQELEEATLSRYDTARGANHAVEVRYHERCERVDARHGKKKEKPLSAPAQDMRRKILRHGSIRAGRTREKDVYDHHENLKNP